MADAAPLEDLEDTVRKSDADLWLSSRFIPAGQGRDAAIAVYAFDHVLARVPFQVSDPLMGEIRLTWWSEVLDEIYDGRPVRAHPVALALADAVRAKDLARAPLDAMIEARMGDLTPEPFASETAAMGYADLTSGAVMQAVAQGLGAHANLKAAQYAGRAYGLAVMAHRRVIGGKTRLPDGMDLRPHVQQAVAEAQVGLSALPVSAFPAVAYACLARRYAKGAHITVLEKQIRLLGAVLTGRI
jgi:phytoene synthase